MSDKQNNTAAGFRLIPVAVLFIFVLMNSLLLIRNTKFADLTANQRRTDELIFIADQAKISQTFTSQRAYLSSIKLLFFLSEAQNDPSTQSTVTLRLFDMLDPKGAVAEAEYPLRNESENFEIQFSFQPQVDSKGKTYLLTLETTARDGQIGVWSSSRDSYSPGELSVDNQKLKSDLAFWTYAKPPAVALIRNLTPIAVQRLLLLFKITLLFFAIGFPLILSLGSGSDHPPGVFVLAVVLGVILPQMVLFGLAATGIASGRNVWFGLGIVYVFCIVAFFKNPKRAMALWPSSFGKAQIMESSGVVLLLGIAIIVRLLQIDQVNVPAWVDGLSHMKIVDRIIRLDMLPVDSIYHMGFHSDVYFLQLVFRHNLPELMLVFGQWLSILSGLTVYCLARRIFRSPLTALLVVSLYWFWSPFPAYLITWSRYPYLLGLALVPMASQGSLDVFDKTRKPVPLTGLILLVGLALSHYGSLLISLAFMAVVFLFKALSEKANPRHNLIQVWSLAGLPLLLIGFKLFFLVREQHLELLLRQGRSAPSVDDLSYLLKLVLDRGGSAIFLGGLLGLLLSVKADRKIFYLIGGWISSLFLIYIVQDLLGFVISGVTNLLIFLCIPAVILSGFLFERMFLKENRQFHFLLSVCVIALIAISGSYNSSGLLNPSTVLYSAVDEKAMDWIIKNTSQNDVFLINSFGWNERISPADGGAWIPFIADREIFLFDPVEFEIVDQRVDYVYFGAGYGDMNIDMLQYNPRYSLVYSDGVMIYKKTALGGTQ